MKKSEFDFDDNYYRDKPIKSNRPIFKPGDIVRCISNTETDEYGKIFEVAHCFKCPVEKDNRIVYFSIDDKEHYNGWGTQNFELVVNEVKPKKEVKEKTPKNWGF